MSFAFVFPGQGSQSVGMSVDLAAAFPVVRDVYAQASAVLGQDLWALATDGPTEMLDQTENTQPVLLAASVACWQAWRAAGGALPQIMAGHSLGEYSALVCAEALSFPDAVRLVRRRAELMQAAVPSGVGAMAAIVGLADEQIQTLCSETGGEGVLEPVNFNAPGQVVIAGHRARVELAVAGATSRGAKLTKLLAVSVPSHCALMKPAADELAKDLQSTEIKTPRIPVIHNLDAQPRATPDGIRDALIQQLYRPVQWVKTIHTLPAQGVTQVIECGPGKVLNGLIKRIDKSLTLGSIHNPDGLAQAQSLLSNS